MNHYYKVFGERPVDIVVELGLGACLSEWIPMAKKLSESYGVLLYERAGINKSEPSERERTPRNIAEELHELLSKVDHGDKIILLAHSQGGLYGQQFCRLYPDMVKGIVLLDPLSARDNEFKRILSQKEYKKSGVDKSGSFRIMKSMARFKMGFLVKKLMKNAPPFYYYNGFSHEERKEILNSFDSVTHADTAIEEYMKAHDEVNISSLKSGHEFPDIPMVLVTHASGPAIEESMKFGNNTRDFAGKIEEMWQEIMKEYLSFSTKSSWLQAERSTHYIHLMEPDIVVKALERIK